ncbi:UNVERIFIED_CONTAM: Clustered mitochondria protein [Sesamum radiatum]|uniref:Clustered mitochondria protein n=1 Tax=Sesamum radiatum TaxID=300843 RepID=A0AAW2R3P2_SESRA
MALFYHGLNQTELALRHMARALLLLSLSSGPDHPDVAATFINVAMMYQDMGKMDTALRYLQEALKKNEKLLGEEHIQTAVCYHALAIAFNCMGAFKLSHQHEKKTYDILVKQLGSSRPDTSISSGCCSRGFWPSAKNYNSPVIGETLARGRGVDERAARAAAEVRKKAAARGLLTRSHGVPVQALPPFTQLLNIINSGVTPDAANETNNGGKKESNEQTSNGVQEPEVDQSKPGQQAQAPMGLGSGLAALDSKKPKTKAKAAS